jgi:hypothetical protein
LIFLQVIDPLRSWLQVEFKRMDDEIQKLHMYTYQYEEAKKNIKKWGFHLACFCHFSTINSTQE